MGAGCRFLAGPVPNKPLKCPPCDEFYMLSRNADLGCVVNLSPLWQHLLVRNFIGPDPSSLGANADRGNLLASFCSSGSNVR
jgi:hypothetical protein